MTAESPQQILGYADDDYVEFWPAGTITNGRFCCATCRCSLEVLYVLPRCPVCDERLWERVERTPRRSWLTP